VHVGKITILNENLINHANYNVALKSVGSYQYQEIGNNSTLNLFISNFYMGKFNVAINYSDDSFIEYEIIKVARISFKYNINSTNQARLFN
jgi:hypothetical protein